MNMEMTRASRRSTSAVLTAGAAIGAVCFFVALLAEQMGAETSAVATTDVAGVLAALPGFDPNAWASLGIYVVLITPVVGIAVTGWEYAAIGDRRTSTLAVAVLVVLAASLVVALIR